MVLATTTFGPVFGIQLKEYQSFRGVRYARSPSGARRFRPPEPPEPWSEPADATRWGNRAVQEFLDPPLARWVQPVTPPPMSEDCLFLNIATPRADSGGRPVLLWLHGGGFRVGHGAQHIGDGELLSIRHGIVVVTLNYRLGPFGYLHLPELLGADYATSGNAGTADQIAALAWVKDNIAAFGGDPTNVTLAGHSAGAKSVGVLLSSPGAHGLFHRAISLSGGANHVFPPAEAEEVTGRFLEAVGIKEGSAERLLELPAEELLAADQAIAKGTKAAWIWRPVIDGIILPERPQSAIEKGSAAGVALLAGTTVEEAAHYCALVPRAEFEAPRVLAEIFGGRAAELLAAYRTSRPEAGESEILRAIFSDERYGVATRRLCDAQSAHGDVFSYRFDARPREFGAAAGGHVTDLMFFFGSYNDTPASPTFEVPEWHRLALQMNEALANFVATGKPEGHELPGWENYRPPRRQTLVFDVVARLEDDPVGSERAAWDGTDWTPGPWWEISPHSVPR